MPNAALPRDMVRRITAFCLILLSFTILSLPALAQDFRLDEAVTPSFQAIELTLDPELTTYSGTVQIELQVQE